MFTDVSHYVIDTSEYINRRNMLSAKVGANTAVILFAGHAPVASLDESYPFLANRTFYYFCGIEQEDSVLILTKEGEKDLFTPHLYIYPREPEKEKWTGKRLSTEEASQISGIRDVRVLEQLKEDLASALGLQVQDDAFFIRVFEVERRILEGASAASFADAGPADRVAALRFDLNDLGALVRQEPRACRDRDHGAELNDFYAFQCLAHGFLLCRVIYSIRN